MDLLDSYQVEYERLLRNPPVRGLLGAYELPAAVYSTTTSAEKIEYCGIVNHTVVDWEDQPPLPPFSDTGDPNATGMTLGLMNRQGEIFPIVFVRNEVRLQNVGEKYEAELTSLTRLLILLHEFGHALDIMQRINFDHEKKSSTAQKQKLMHIALRCAMQKKPTIAWL